MPTCAPYFFWVVGWFDGKSPSRKVSKTCVSVEESSAIIVGLLLASGRAFAPRKKVIKSSTKWAFNYCLLRRKQTEDNGKEIKALKRDGGALFRKYLLPSWFHLKLEQNAFKKINKINQNNQPKKSLPMFVSPWLELANSSFPSPANFIHLKSLIEARGLDSLLTDNWITGAKPV